MAVSIPYIVFRELTRAARFQAVTTPTTPTLHPNPRLRVTMKAFVEEQILTGHATKNRRTPNDPFRKVA